MTGLGRDQTLVNLGNGQMGQVGHLGGQNGDVLESETAAIVEQGEWNPLLCFLCHQVKTSFIYDLTPN